jgi:chromosome segregation ATPase
LIERNNNSNSVLQQEFSEQLSKKDITIDSLRNKIEELNENCELLQSAYNDNCKYKEDMENSCIQLQELNNSYKLNIGKLQEELTGLQELKSINKRLNEEINSIKELLSKQQADNIALNDNIKQKEHSIDQLNKTIEDNRVFYKADLERLNKEHEKDIRSIKDKLGLEKEKAVLELKQLHQEEIEKLQSKYNADISKYNADYKKLLEELNKNSHTNKRPAASSKQTK